MNGCIEVKGSSSLLILGADMVRAQMDFQEVVMRLTKQSRGSSRSLDSSKDRVYSCRRTSATPAALILNKVAGRIR